VGTANLWKTAGGKQQMKTREFTRPDAIVLFLLALTMLVAGINAYSEFSQEWSLAALDVVFTAVILVVGMCLAIYYRRSTDKDDSSRRLKQIMTCVLLVIFAPYILPRWRLFELLDAIGGLGLLAGMVLGYVIWELQALGEQRGESSE
jgi:hypothetical protein